MALGLFAQIGLIAHLFSVLAPALGEQNAGFAMAWVTMMAVLGRTIVGWLLHPGVDRRLIAAASYGLQIIASLVFVLADGIDPALLLVGATMYGLAFGNGTYLPPLIAQSEFAPTEVARVVALVVAISQAAYAFAPGVFGILREQAIGASTGSQSATGAIFVVAATVQLLALLSFLMGRDRL